MSKFKYSNELHGDIRVFFTTSRDLKRNSALLKDLAKLNIEHQLRAIAHDYGTPKWRCSKEIMIDKIRIAVIEKGPITGDQDCVDLSTWFPSRDRLEKFLSSDTVRVVTDTISGRIGPEGNQAVNLSGEDRVFVDPNLALFAGSYLENHEDLIEFYDFLYYSPLGVEGEGITKEIVEVMDSVLRENGASRGLTSAKPTSFNIRNSCYLIKVNDLVTVGLARHPHTGKNQEGNSAPNPRAQEKNLDELLATQREVHGANLEVVDVFQFRFSKQARDFGKVIRLVLGNSFLEVDRGPELVSYRCPDPDSVQLIQEAVTYWFELMLVREQHLGRKHCVQFYNEETRALFDLSGKG